MNSIRVVSSRVPVRIDFAGGWTDVPLFTSLRPGIVVNAAITLYTYAEVSALPGETKKVSRYGYPTKEYYPDSTIRLYSLDLDEYVEAANIQNIEYNGTMDLIKAACKKMEIEGVEIVTRSDAPAGSGLGTSASLGVSLIGALSLFKRKRECGDRCAQIAFELETEELGLLSGTQDQYGAASGYINYITCMKKAVKVHWIPVVNTFQYMLEKSLVLVYTGHSRLSSNLHSNVVAAFKEGENHGALSNLVESGLMAHEALCKSNMNLLGEAINLSWENQKKLHSSITNEQIEHLFELAQKNGMLAGKACGAGGGGCLLFLAQHNKEHLLRAAMKAAGVEILNFTFDTTGLQIWEQEI